MVIGPDRSSTRIGEIGVLMDGVGYVVYSKVNGGEWMSFYTRMAGVIGELCIEFYVIQ